MAKVHLVIACEVQRAQGFVTQIVSFTTIMIAAGITLPTVDVICLGSTYKSQVRNGLPFSVRPSNVKRLFLSRLNQRYPHIRVQDMLIELILEVSHTLLRGRGQQRDRFCSKFFIAYQDGREGFTMVAVTVKAMPVQTVGHARMESSA